jgi:hypothetical protein
MRCASLAGRLPAGHAEPSRSQDASRRDPGVSTTPSARRPRSAAAVEGKTLLAKQGRGRPPRAAPSKSGGREAGARTPSLGERVLALATGITRRELYAASPGDRPNHVGMAVQRHIRAGRIQERGGKLYAISTAAE